MSEQLDEEPARPRLSLPISRQRLVELAIVVFGVMIALGLENLVEEVRLRGDARKLEEAFRYDISSAIQYSWERQAVDKCLTDNLAALTERAMGEGGWDAAPAASEGSFALALPAPYRAPVRLWMTTSFDRALGTEAFKRIPRERADAYAVLFASITSRRDGNVGEFDSTARLAPLAFPMTGVDSEVRAEMLQALSELDRDRALAVLQAEQFLIRAMSVPGGGDIRAGVLEQRDRYDETTLSLRAAYGECVDGSATDRLMRFASEDRP
ncbi:MAG: hypothetical protein V4701_06015 [Pseudomonadota bacterium]